MAIDWRVTSRGALAGAVAATATAAQQPLDKHAFASDYDDVALLGKAAVRGAPWYLPGLALHIQNGMLFGAIYANVARRVPLPAWSRGPLAGLIEHVGLWPLVMLTDRLHPRRDELPVLAGNARAFAQATWRHLLFGVVLGELERRLNPPEDPLPPSYQGLVSSNGHGDIDLAVGAAAAGAADVDSGEAPE